jgi:pre-mRNA-splicing helicase BRR2
MVSRRMWLSHSPLRQFGNALKPDIIRKIEKKDIPWERYYDLSPQDLGEPLQLPKMGKKLHRLIHQFPKVTLLIGAHHISVCAGYLIDAYSLLCYVLCSAA